MNRLAIVLLLACSVTVASGQEQTPSPEVALADAEARWRARKPKSYEFAVEVRCFCPDLTRTPPRFAVTDGEPRSLQELASFSQKTYDYFNTVEKLFAAIRGRVARGKNKMVVQYHADLGYPLVADLDPNADVADDELFLRVTDFKVTAQAKAPPLQRPATSAEIDDVVRQVLADRIAANDLPSWNTSHKNGRRIAVRADPVRLPISKEALPGIDGYEFRLITIEEAQAESDKTKQSVYFIAIERLHIQGDTASLWIGVDFTMPADSKFAKLCCCSRPLDYRRVDGKWVFVGWDWPIRCS